ncbi:MAG: universal stress protein, partial [Treponema sp.]|nr:universal stress protein [Treponema sp.]
EGRFRLARNRCVGDEFGADLIILGGKKADNLVERYKTSSTNSEIIGSANCNVLIVKQGDVDGLFKLA